jgi:hypothetical protein
MGAEILVEQSLSDFGDADAALLLHREDWRLVVFIEGKVKPSQIASWRIETARNAFLGRQDGRLDSSNLFTQLYPRVRFIHGLRTLGINGLVQGIAFPACSTKTMRKLGSNPVVRKAAAMIGEYAAANAAAKSLVNSRPTSATSCPMWSGRALNSGEKSSRGTPAIFASTASGFFCAVLRLSRSSGLTSTLAGACG